MVSKKKMIITKKTYIDDSIKWTPLIKYKLTKKNEYKGTAFIICCFPNKAHNLAEIVPTRSLNRFYDDAVVLAIFKWRKDAIDYVVEMVDSIYNTKTKTLEDYISTKKKKIM